MIKIKVGLFLSSKKVSVFSGIIGKCFSKDKIEIEFIDCLGQQACPDDIDVIVHKTTDLTATQLETFNTTILLNSNAVVVDSLESVEKLRRRSDMLILLEQATRNTTVRVPRFELASTTTLSSSNIFPAIIKNQNACAKSKSHLMFYAESFSTDLVDLLKSDDDFLLMEFIPHVPVLIKVYVMGDFVYYQTRPSVVPTTPVMHFDSQKLSKQFETKGESDEADRILENLDNTLIEDFCGAIRNVSGLSLFGFDVIISETGEPFVVDLNYFPSFSNIPSFNSVFVDYICSTAKRLLYP